MIDFVLLTSDDRNPYFEEVARIKGVTSLIVEKDFWVCFLLNVLFSMEETKEILVFKGGTSLSKVYGVIDRFSEDVDLSIDPDWLGLGGSNYLSSATSRTQRNKRIREHNDACCMKVQHELLPALTRGVIEAGLTEADAKNLLLYELDTRTDSPLIFFRYPSKVTANDGVIKPEVKLEMGSLSDQNPVNNMSISSWVADQFPNLFRNKKFSVVALAAERTFWEKITILHAESHRPLGVPMRQNMSRDIYDVWSMSKNELGVNALDDFELLERVVEYKKVFFYSRWASYETAKPGSLVLLPHNDRLVELRSDYSRMREMFWGNVPSFEDLMSGISDLQDMINSN